MHYYKTFFGNKEVSIEVLLLHLAPWPDLPLSLVLTVYSSYCAKTFPLCPDHEKARLENTMARGGLHQSETCLFVELPQPQCVSAGNITRVGIMFNL